MAEHDVFISYSGSFSKAVADGLNDLIKSHLPNIQTFVFPPEPGERAAKKLFEALDHTRFGVICVTPDNVHEPWIHFEAGALMKPLNQRLIVPLLCELGPDMIERSLQEFSCRPYTPLGVAETLESIGECFRQDPVAHNAVESDWQSIVDNIKSKYTTSTPADTRLGQIQTNLNFIDEHDNEFRKFITIEMLSEIAAATHEMCGPHKIFSDLMFVASVTESLKSATSAIALCGSKPWSKEQVDRYYDKNLEFAARRSQESGSERAWLTRVFVRPKGGFVESDQEIIDRHIATPGAQARILPEEQLSELHVPDILAKEPNRRGFGFIAVEQDLTDSEVYAHLAEDKFRGRRYSSWLAVQQIIRWCNTQLVAKSYDAATGIA